MHKFLQFSLIFLIMFTNCQDPTLRTVAKDTMVSESSSHIAGQYIIYINPNAIEFEKMPDSMPRGDSDEERIARAKLLREVKGMNQEKAVEWLHNTFGLSADQVVSVRTGSRALNGAISATIKDITAAEIERIRKNKDIIRVDLNEVIKGFGNLEKQNLSTPSTTVSTSISQNVNCAIQAVNGPHANIYNLKRIWIIDVGVDFDNPDLNIETSPFLSICTLTECNSNDTGEVSCPGTFGEIENNSAPAQHGSVIAEIAAAIDNSIGGVGVAPNAKIISIKAAYTAIHGPT